MLCCFAACKSSNKSSLRIELIIFQAAGEVMARASPLEDEVQCCCCGEAELRLS